MKIYLMRHGQTEWNRDGRIQGSLDSPLTPDGRSELECWANFLSENMPGITSIWASPLPRTRATAAIISSKISLPIQLCPQLREQDWGEWEGKKWSEIEQQWPGELERQSARGWEFTPPAGEQRTLLRDRSFAAVQKIIDAKPAGDTLLITHQGVIRSLIYQLSGRDFLPSEKKILQKRTLQELGYHKGQLCINQLNIGLAPCI